MQQHQSTHEFLAPITFDEGDDVRDVFLFPVGITPNLSQKDATHTLTPQTQALKDSFMAAYMRDNNLTPLLYQPLYYSLSNQVDNVADTIARWFSLLARLPANYEHKQIIVEVPLEVRMEHWEYTDTLCWNLRTLDASVERVAEQIVRDQALDLQWTMLISHALRAQILRKMLSFLTRGNMAGYLKEYIDAQEEQIVHNDSQDFSITRRVSDDLKRYQPTVRELTDKEIRESKKFVFE